jgi:hypothetical protein
LAIVAIRSLGQDYFLPTPSMKARASEPRNDCFFLGGLGGVARRCGSRSALERRARSGTRRRRESLVISLLPSLACSWMLTSPQGPPADGTGLVQDLASGTADGTRLPLRCADLSPSPLLHVTDAAPRNRGSRWPSSEETIRPPCARLWSDRMPRRTSSACQALS